MRGARVQRVKWFYDVVAELQKRHFTRTTPPSGVPHPRLYYFARDKFTVQILPKNSLKIVRPNGRQTVESLRSISEVEFVLNALTFDIEFPD